MRTRLLSGRRALAELFHERGYKRGVEIGVYEAGFLSEMAERIPDAVIYGVDPWRRADGLPMALELIQAARAVSKFGGRVRLIVAASLEAAELFPDASLDFVFVDGDHSFEGATADCRTWFPKVRPGGIFSGHDFANHGHAICPAQAMGTDRGRRRVARAVKRFAAEIGRAYMRPDKSDSEGRCWWFDLADQ